MTRDVVPETPRPVVTTCKTCGERVMFITVKNPNGGNPNVVSVYATRDSTGNIHHTGDGHGERWPVNKFPGDAELYRQHCHAAGTTPPGKRIEPTDIASVFDVPVEVVSDEPWRVFSAAPLVERESVTDLAAMFDAVEPHVTEAVAAMFTAPLDEGPAPYVIRGKWSVRGDLTGPDLQRAILNSPIMPDVKACSRCGATTPHDDPKAQSVTCLCGGAMTVADGKLHEAGILDGPREQMAAVEREDAIQRAEDHAPEGWQDAAVNAIRTVASTHARFTADDVWDTGLPAPPTPAALGPAFRAASRAGVCQPTSMTMPSRYPQRHRDLKVWESLIVPRVPTPTVQACTSCGDQILMVPHERTGNVMPLDAVSVSGGEWQIETVEGGFRCRHDKTRSIGHVPHWATCTNPEAHRKG